MRTKVERLSHDKATSAGRARKALWEATGHSGNTRDYLVWLSAMWAEFREASTPSFTDFLFFRLAAEAA